VIPQKKPNIQARAAYYTRCNLGVFKVWAFCVENYVESVESLIFSLREKIFGVESLFMGVNTPPGSTNSCTALPMDVMARKRDKHQDFKQSKRTLQPVGARFLRGR